jgi:hypothetical protein
MRALASDNANCRRVISHLFSFPDAGYQNIFNHAGFIILQGDAESVLATEVLDHQVVPTKYR